jgi:hypothetical protein
MPLDGLGYMVAWNLAVRGRSLLLVQSPVVRVQLEPIRILRDLPPVHSVQPGRTRIPLE